jgi:hypothetical protein
MKFIFFLLLFTFKLFSSELVELPEKVDDANIRLLKVLTHITDGEIRKVDKTRGFDYRYASKWYSPFSLDIFIGTVKTGIDTCIIRIEAKKRGEEKLIKSILQKELLKQEDTVDKEKGKDLEKPISKKSHLVSQSLNVLMPYSSILYNSYHSPTYTFRDTLVSASAYAFWDILLISIGAFYINNTVKGKSFQDDLLSKQGPRYGILQNKIGGFVLAGMAASRIYRAWGSYEDIGVHNRSAELSYTFSF